MVIHFHWPKILDLKLLVRNLLVIIEGRDRYQSRVYLFGSGGCDGTYLSQEPISYVGLSGVEQTVGTRLRT